MMEALFSVHSVQQYGQRLSQKSNTIVSNDHDMPWAGLHVAASTLSTSLCARVLLGMGAFINAHENNYCQCQVPQCEQEQLLSFFIARKK